MNPIENRVVTPKGASMAFKDVSKEFQILIARNLVDDIKDNIRRMKSVSYKYPTKPETDEVN